PTHTLANPPKHAGIVEAVAVLLTDPTVKRSEVVQVAAPEGFACEIHADELLGVVSSGISGSQIGEVLDHPRGASLAELPDPQLVEEAGAGEGRGLGGWPDQGQAEDDREHRRDEAKSHRFSLRQAEPTRGSVHPAPA